MYTTVVMRCFRDTQAVLRTCSTVQSAYVLCCLGVCSWYPVCVYMNVYACVFYKASCSHALYCIHCTEHNSFLLHALYCFVQELLVMFQDMALMVEAQGEVLDAVEANVGKAHADVKGGVRELQTARKWQKSTRRWGIFGMGVLVTVLAVGLIVAMSYSGIAFPVVFYIQLGIAGSALLMYAILGLGLVFCCD